jgi:hypothetical protein
VSDNEYHTPRNTFKIGCSQKAAKNTSLIFNFLFMNEGPQPTSTKPCRTSHPSSLPDASENETPHAEKYPKKERFSPLFSIFGGAVENGEKWRKSMVFRRFLSVW